MNWHVLLVLPARAVHGRRPRARGRDEGGAAAGAARVRDARHPDDVPRAARTTRGSRSTRSRGCRCWCWSTRSCTWPRASACRCRKACRTCRRGRSTARWSASPRCSCASASPASVDGLRAASSAVKHWVQGARPRTLPAAVVPVLVGTACAVGERPGGLVWWRAGAALVVALAIQVATNYANDYSDGKRGTDDPSRRVGPVRLVGWGIKPPARGEARRAARRSRVAGVAGLALAIAVGLGAARRRRRQLRRRLVLHGRAEAVRLPRARRAVRVRLLRRRGDDRVVVRAARGGAGAGAGGVGAGRASWPPRCSS